METTVDGGSLPGRIERALAILTLVLFSGGFISIWFGEGDADRPELRLVWLPIYVCTLALVVPRLGQVWQVVKANWWVVALVVLCLASTLWSIEPGVTLRRAVAVGATTLFGVYLAARYDALGRLDLLAMAFAIIAVASVLVALGLPQYGVTQVVHPGAWRGVFPQKNALGQTMVYGAGVFLVLALVRRDHRRWAWAGFAVCLVLVALSTSVTSLIALLMLLALTGATVLLFRVPAIATVAIYACVIGAVGFTIALLTNPEAVFGLIGRDATLTGRTDIWEPVWDMMQRRFWLGYGYNAFWQDPDGPAWYIRKWLQWEVPSAHNGWVEVWLDIGFVGVAVFTVSFVIAIIRTLARLRIGEADVGLWPLLFLALFLVFSFSESSILRHNDLVWTMYVSTVAAYGFRPLPRREGARYYAGMAQAAAAPQQWSYWR